MFHLKVIRMMPYKLFVKISRQQKKKKMELSTDTAFHYVLILLQGLHECTVKVRYDLYHHSNKASLKVITTHVASSGTLNNRTVICLVVHK